MADEYIKKTEAEEYLSQPITMSTCLSIEECKARRRQQEVDILLLRAIPAADVQPVRHGRYIIDDNGDSSCSECGEWYLDVTKNYCPNCGARLDLEAERW